MTDKKDETTLLEEAGSSAEFLRAQSKEENGVFSAGKPAYLEFAQRHGITRDVLESVNNMHNRLIDGQTAMLQDKMVEAVKSKRDAGESADGLKLTSRISTIEGQQTLIMHSHEVFPVPTREGESKKDPVHRFGRTELRISKSFKPTKALAENAARLIQAAGDW